MQRLIPSLLLKGGRLVKGVRFRDYRDSGRPDTITRAHNAQGADEITVVDIEASPQKRGPDIDAIRQIAQECFMPLTVGGGICSVDDARACMAAGADKVMLTTTALDDPAPGFRGHARAKAMGSRAAQFARLKCAFHRTLPARASFAASAHCATRTQPAANAQDYAVVNRLSIAASMPIRRGRLLANIRQQV